MAFEVSSNLELWSQIAVRVTYHSNNCQKKVFIVSLTPNWLAVS